MLLEFALAQHGAQVVAHSPEMRLQTQDTDDSQYNHVVRSTGQTAHTPE